MDDLCNSSASEESETLEKNISVKSDIQKVGFLLLKMMKFEVVDENNVVVPDFQPPELKEFIEKCLIENEKGRWTAKKLLNHKFVIDREQSVQKTKFPGIEKELRVEKRIEKPYESIFQGNDDGNSRLLKEFKILDKVGNGSFGKVLKVNHITGFGK